MISDIDIRYPASNTVQYNSQALSINYLASKSYRLAFCLSISHPTRFRYRHSIYDIRYRYRYPISNTAYNNSQAFAGIRVDTLPLALVGETAEISAAVARARLVAASTRPLETKENHMPRKRGRR